MMRYRSAVVAAVATLGLVAATGGAAAPAGTATTEITAAEVTLTGPVPVDALSVLDLTSFASTDHDTERNPAGGPFASVFAVPAAVAGQSFGEASVTSDDDGDVRIAAVDERVGPLSATVNALKVSATAGDEQAAAVLDAATARLAGLSGAFGLSLDDAGSRAQVTSDGADAFQGLTLSELGIDLGDVLPDLEALPLDVVLDLARELAGQLSGTLGELVDTVAALEDQFQVAAGGLSGAIGDYEAASAELSDVLAQLADEQALLAELERQLAEADALLASGSATQDAVDDLVDRADDTVDDTVDDAVDTVDDAVDDTVGALLGGLRAQQTDVDAQLTELIADLEAAIADTEAAIAALQDDVDELVEELVDLLAVISGLVDDLESLFADLLDSVQDLVSQLPDVLDAIAAADLVDVGEVRAGLTASATATGADARVDCVVSGVTVAGLDLTPRDCLEPVTGATAAVGDALTALEGLLGALPVAGDVVPEARFEMFHDVREETGTDGAYHTALAHVTILDLEIPSVELETVTGGLLDGLASGDLAAVLDELEDRLRDDVGGDAGSLGGDLLDALNATLAEVTAALPVVEQVEATLADVLGGLPAVDALDGLSTVGVRATVDPTVTAQFRGGRSGAPGESSPESGRGGDPDDPDRSSSPTPTPALPTTGGGLVVLALLSMAAGTALWRRSWTS